MKSEWKEVRLGDICKTNASSYSNKEDWEYINYLDTGNITQNKIESIAHLNCKTDKIPSRARRKVNEGDIIYSNVRPNQLHYGLMKNIPTNFLVSTGFTTISVNKDLADNKFIYYYIIQESITQKLQNIAEQSVSAYPSIKPSDLEELIIQIPIKISDQKAIASILSALDDKIALNQQINNNLEQQAQAIFKSWFVDNINPMWEEGTVSDIGMVVGGGTPSKTKPEYYTEQGIAWITPKDLSINKSKFIAKGANDITEIGLKNSSAKLMPEGTVLFSSRAPIGYIAIAAGEVSTNQGFKSIIPKEEIGTAYVYYFLKQNLSVIEGMASGSTFKEVSGSTMKSIPAIIPDKDILSKFNDICKPIFEKQKSLEQENERLAITRDTLLPKLMAGEMEV